MFLPASFQHPQLQLIDRPGLILVQATDGLQIKPNPISGGTVAGPFNPLDRPELWLSLACILFGLIILIGQFYLLRRISSITADDIIKNSTITCVIIGALILIIAGYNSQQTAQAFGLFGTIVGYMLGRSARVAETK